MHVLSCGGLKYEDISYIAASGHSGVINHPTSNLVEDIWGNDPNLVWCCIPLSATPWEEITKKQHDLLSLHPIPKLDSLAWINVPTPHAMAHKASQHTNQYHFY